MILIICISRGCGQKTHLAMILQTAECIELRTLLSLLGSEFTWADILRLGWKWVKFGQFGVRMGAKTSFSVFS